MIKKDFKQKYFLYCKDCKVQTFVKKYSELDKIDYICKRIKIIEYD